ncbi:MAG: FAD-dependent oxidoreductase [Chromatiaceae bacterium]|nr:FAD-dependent oxidoreductase [Chromatiaceae bacterium]
MSEVFEHIVVGGGISGLGLAHGAARRGIQTLVLEAAERVGGCINSQGFPDCGGFWVEAGTHTCYNSYGHLLDILGDLGLMARLTPKAKVSFFLWRDGKRQSIFSALRLWELLRSMPRLFTTKKGGLSVRDYYAPGLGAANYRDLFGPAFSAVICQEADDFPADLLFRRKPRRKEVLRSFTLPQGLSEIPLAMARQPGLALRTGQTLHEIRRDGAGFRLLMADGNELSCATLSLATPPDVVARLLGAPAGPVVDQEAVAAIAGIGMREIESLVLCVSAQALGHLPPSAGLIAVGEAFNAMVSRDYLADGAYRGFSFHFRPGALTPEDQQQRACAALGIAPVAISGLARVHNRLPALRVGHGERVARIDTALAGTRLGITGNWFQGVSVEDCLTRSHQECERLFA